MVQQHFRGHREPVTLEEKAARLAKHADSLRRHHHILQGLRDFVAPPAAFDCRAKGWVPPIVDQAQCGSCWDFSGTSICTSAFMLAMGAAAPGPLSEQYTLDCGSNGGCNGDDNTTVTAWAKATGLPTSAAYGPYSASAGKCKSGSPLNRIADWGYCTPSNTNAPAAVADIKVAMMQYGPIGSGIDASSSAFDNYTSGVFTAAPSSNIDHDIVLVGWQDDATVSGGGYWILRNSWGTIWGNAGYMNISYGSAGVGWEAIWAVVAGSPPPPPPPPPTGTYTLAPATTPAAGNYSLTNNADGSILLTPTAVPVGGITGVTPTTTVQQLMDAAKKGEQVMPTAASKSAPCGGCK